MAFFELWYPVFSPERGYCSSKIIQNDLCWITFSDKGRGCDSCKTPSRSANDKSKIEKLPRGKLSKDMASSRK